MSDTLGVRDFLKTAFGILLVRRVNADGAMADLSAAPAVVEVEMGSDVLRVTIEYIKGGSNDTPQ